jgi:hypothetical protein
MAPNDLQTNGNEETPDDNRFQSNAQTVPEERLTPIRTDGKNNEWAAP